MSSVNVERVQDDTLFHRWDHWKNMAGESPHALSWAQHSFQFYRQRKERTSCQNRKEGKEINSRYL